MRVRNDGHTDLHGVAVTDPGCDAPPTVRSDGNGDATLSPHETWTYGCTHVVRADSATWFATTARVAAASAHGSVHASARSATRVLRPSLTITVRPEPISGTPGDTVAYRFVVRNDGNATLTHLVVIDDQLGHVGTTDTLAPGHTVTFSVDRVLSARHVWVIDTATATAQDPSGHPVSDHARASVTIVRSSGGGRHRCDRGRRRHRVHRQRRDRPGVGLDPLGRGGRRIAPRRRASSQLTPTGAAGSSHLPVMEMTCTVVPIPGPPPHP